MKTFTELFDNPYNPKLDVVKFHYITPEEIPDEQPNSVEMIQKKDVQSEEKPVEQKKESTSLEPVFEIKDITPRKPFWRK